MRIAIVAGTGTAGLVTARDWSQVDTPFGPAFVAVGRIGGRDIAVLARHGPGMNIPPHLINYRANMWALKEAQITRVIATAAVGSLREGLRPGTFAAVTDFIDFTKRRVGTFFEQPRDTVMHTDFSVPYCPRISGAIGQAAVEVGAGDCPPATYVCVDGPRYETPAEVHMFASWGGDVVGMTGVPEVVLARELGLCYGALAIITNYAAGISAEPLSHAQVVESVAEQGPLILDLLHRVVALTYDDQECEHCVAKHPDSPGTDA